MLEGSSYNYKVIPKRNYLGAYEYGVVRIVGISGFSAGFSYKKWSRAAAAERWNPIAGSKPTLNNIAIWVLGFGEGALSVEKTR